VRALASSCLEWDATERPSFEVAVLRMQKALEKRVGAEGRGEKPKARSCLTCNPNRNPIRNLKRNPKRNPNPDPDPNPNPNRNSNRNPDPNPNAVEGGRREGGPPPLPPASPGATRAATSRVVVTLTPNANPGVIGLLCYPNP